MNIIVSVKKLTDEKTRRKKPMYAHNTAVPNRMIDIYSDSRMIAKEKKHPSRHFGKGV